MSGCDLLVSKKAQLTVFIILGVLIMIGAGLVIFLSQEAPELPSEIAEGERVPDEFKPIKEFVEDCLQEKLEEAFVRIGQHGGYIDMADSEFSGRSFELDPESPTSSDAAFMSPSDSSHVSYWWYMQSDNKCLDCYMTDENKPGLEYIEGQSDRYIDENLESCIDGFGSFEDQGFDIKTSGRPYAETTITEEDVVVLLTYPVNASLGDSSDQMTKYYARIPLGFREFYDLAEEINTAEIENSFLEYLAKEIIGLYGSGATSNQLPPIYFREESYVPKIWNMKVVELGLRSLLTSHVPLLNLNGTNNSHRIRSDDPFTDGIYRSFHHNNILQEDYSDFSVNFYYFDWPVYLYIGPGDGDTLSATRVLDIPTEIMGMTIEPSVPIREYAFFYDLSYPIIVEVRREDDLFGDGYSFFFAIESNIRDNRDVQEWMRGNGTYGSNIQELFTAVDITTSELPESEEEAETGLEESINRSRESAESLFCNPKQRISGNMTFVVEDSVSGEEMEGVKVKFGCGFYEFCSMGITEFDIEMNRTSLVSKLPVCFGGGIIKFEKEGYLDEVILDLSVGIDDSEEFVVEMSPIIEKEVDMTKVFFDREIIYWDPYDNYGNDYTKRLVYSGRTAEPHPENDSILIMIRKIDLSPFATYQTQVVSYDPDLNSSSIDLTEGIYEVKATFIDAKGVTIVPELRCADHDAHTDYESGADKDGCYFLPEEDTVIEQVIGGGLELVNESGYWVVTEDMLVANNSILFKIIQLPQIVRTEEMDEMGLIVNLTEKYRPLLEPVFQSN